jgi:serine/threonine protein kinase
MTAEPRPGEPFGPYLVEGELGRGGMGVVYRARDTRLGRRVALKVIAPDLAAAPEFRARFEREAHIAATLEHPHIVPVYEAGALDGRLFMAMRLIDGADLGDEIRRHGPLEPSRLARLVGQFAGALDAAHRAGMVHRDVKPANALLAGSGDDEHAFLSDFGLTRDAASQSGLTNTGQWMGTLDYAPPEQIEGRSVDARSDVYALGCVVFHALTGAAPYGGTPAAKLNGHLNGRVPSVRAIRGELSHDVERVVLRAMAKDPATRFPSAGDFGRALTAAVAGVPNQHPEHSVATGRALTGIPTLPEGATAVHATEALTALTRPESRPALSEPIVQERLPPAERPRRRRPAVLVLSALALFAAGATAAVLAASSLKTGVERGPDERAARTGDAADAPTATPTATPEREKPRRQRQRATPRATATPPPTPEPTITRAPSPSAASLGYRPYVPNSASYSAELPTSGGWNIAGERELNPGLLRTTITGPAGAQLWVDVTPAEPPSFSTSGVEVLSDTRLAGGIREIVFTGGGPDFCKTDACVDYQIDLGDSGIAVLAGPGVKARAVARRVTTSLDPQL